MSQSIAVIGTLDTKGDQIEYLLDRMKGNGNEVIMMDIGVLGDVPFKPHISREAVAKAGGSSLEEIIAINDVYRAMEKMTKGASGLIRDLYENGKLGGVVAVGGSMGTALALEVMKELPIFFPKLILSSITYSPAITPDMMDSDIIMLPWVAGLWGLNSMSKQVLETAARTISGAVKVYDGKRLEMNNIVGITSLGGSIFRYMEHLKPALERRGYEAAVFHPTGIGGRLLEKAVSDGLVKVVLDLSVGAEIVNEVTGGVATAGKYRLEAAGKMGIPQIVSPSGMEAFHWGEDRQFPLKYGDRPRNRHNRLLNVIISSAEEKAAVGKFMAEKLNLATGPTAVVIPMKRARHGEETGNETGEAAKIIENHKKGLEAFIEAFMKIIRPEIRVVILEDAGVNDHKYVDTVLALFDEMMIQ